MRAMHDTPKTFALLTLQETADVLRVHKRTVYRLISEEKLAAVKVGGQWRVSERALLDFIDSGGEKTVQKTKTVQTKKPEEVQLPLPLS